MAIRLREVDGNRIALCAAKTGPLVGDVYLDDAAHHALTTKFALDFQSEGLVDSPPHDPELALLMRREEMGGTADAPPDELDELIRRVENAAAALRLLATEHVDVLMQDTVSAADAMGNENVILAQAAERDLMRALKTYQAAATGWMRKEAGDGHETDQSA